MFFKALSVPVANLFLASFSISLNSVFLLLLSQAKRGDASPFSKANSSPPLKTFLQGQISVTKIPKFTDLDGSRIKNLPTIPPHPRK